MKLTITMLLSSVLLSACVCTYPSEPRREPLSTLKDTEGGSLPDKAREPVDHHSEPEKDKEHGGEGHKDKEHKDHDREEHRK